MGAPSSPVYRCRSQEGRWSFTVPEGGAVVVGRTPGLADIAIPSPALARQDVQFRCQGAVLTVEHMGRRGSLLLNGEFLLGRVSPPLHAGDEIMLLSEVVFVVEIVDTAS
jgi:hypothetical protein